MEFKIYPISGLQISKDFVIPVYQIKIGSEIYFEKVIFVNRGYISNIAQGVQCKYNLIEIEEAKELLKIFGKTKTFAIVFEHEDPNIDIYHLRIAISLLYIAHFLYCKDTGFKKNIWELGTIVFGEDDKCYEYADAKVGTQEINSNDFDLKIPCLYSFSSETPSYKMDKSVLKCDMLIQADIEIYIQKLIPLVLNHKISQNVKSALNIFYYILPQNNLDVSIMYLANALEALLIRKNENGNIKKKISVRTACLVSGHTACLKDINYIADWIKYFYELRCKIVHEGYTSINSDIEDKISIQTSLRLAKYSIPYILESFIDNDIQTSKDIIKFMENTGKIYGAKSSFDFITGTLRLTNE